MKRPKKRLNLSLSISTIKQIDDIKMLTGATTANEIIRKAVKLYAYATEHNLKDAIGNPVVIL